jgi:DNA-binding sugar fermentation-stimulating protein
LNRFAALVEVAGRQVMVHVANSGRMQELLQPGNPCGLVRVERPGRKTAYDLALVEIRAPGHAAHLREKSPPFRPSASTLDSTSRPQEQGAGRALLEIPLPASEPHGGTGAPPQPSASTPGSTARPQGKGAGLALLLVSADARLPNQLVWEALQESRLEPFAGYTQFRREVTVGESRLDLALEGSSGRCLLEVKSVTLVEDGVGVFPDAPTERGRRHVTTLTRALSQDDGSPPQPSASMDDSTSRPQGKGAQRPGDRSAVVFVIQREDATALTLNDRTDPAFGAALRAAVAQGVEAYAYTCRVTRQEVRILEQVPVLL